MNDWGYLIDFSISNRVSGDYNIRRNKVIPPERCGQFRLFPKQAMKMGDVLVLFKLRNALANRKKPFTRPKMKKQMKGSLQEILCNFFKKDTCSLAGCSFGG